MLASTTVSDVKVERIGGGLGAALGGAATEGPNVASVEMSRRREVMQSAQAAAPAAVSSKAKSIRDAFTAAYSGFWIVNFANEQFVNRCMVPNVRLLDWIPAASASDADVAAAHAQAKRRLVELAMDARVQSVPSIVPANHPTQIPYSVAAASAPGHVLAKLGRNGTRHAQFIQLRTQEFQEHVRTQTAGATEMSEYHRWKSYGQRRKTLRLAGAYAPAQVADGDEVTAADALRQAAAHGHEVLAKLGSALAGSGGTAAAAVDVPNIDGDGAASAPVPAAPAAAPAAASVAQSVVASVQSAFRDAAPQPVLSADSLPSKWQMADGVVDGSAVLETWPRDLEGRGRFACIAMVDDLDVAGDSPEFADAAGVEPIIILFGGAYSDLEDAKAANRHRIAPWCKDLDIDVVDMYEFLWPTEVDEDKITEEHRTGQSGYNEELNTVMRQRGRQLDMVSQARAFASTAGATLPETNVNAAEVPDIDQAVAAVRTGMVHRGTETAGRKAEDVDAATLPSI